MFVLLCVKQRVITNPSHKPQVLERKGQVSMNAGGGGKIENALVADPRGQ